MSKRFFNQQKCHFGVQPLAFAASPNHNSYYLFRSALLTMDELALTVYGSDSIDSPESYQRPSLCPQKPGEPEVATHR